MTHESPRLSARNLGYVFMAALMSSLGTHYMDVVIVKARVDENTEARRRFEAFEAQDLPQLRELNTSIWLMNKRLCAYLVSHGESDPECSKDLWKEYQASKSQ